MIFSQCFRDMFVGVAVGVMPLKDFMRMYFLFRAVQDKHEAHGGACQVVACVVACASLLLLYVLHVANMSLVFVKLPDTKY